MASYEYDETGQSNFFLLTFLLLLLTPFTYSTLRPNPERKVAQPPCKGWNVKSAEVKRGRGGSAGWIKKRHVLLVLGWALFGYVTYRASFVKGAAATYDPFEILGISSSADEKSIKRHYKRLSLKFHPDKLKLKENQTAEEANAHFVDLTKAYKSLTDEVIRKNYELYGHPDGKRDTSMGIALPKWIIESKNNGWVIGVYGLAFGLLLPYFVSRWWSGSRKYTKDQVLTESAGMYFQSLLETTTFSSAVEILACSSEFRTICDPRGRSDGDVKREGKGGKEWKKLEEDVKRTVLEKTGQKLEGKRFQGRQYAKRSAVFIYAHLFRIPIEDVSLLKEKTAVIAKAHQLVTGMQSIVLSYNWLATYLVLCTLHQSLLQAVHPSLPPLLQLPHISVPEAEAVAAGGVRKVEDFVGLQESERKRLFPGLGEGGNEEEALQVARKWPKLDLVSATFKVVGEKAVTPGCFIQLITKVRLSPPSSDPSAKVPEANGSPAAPAEDGGVKGEEMEIEELIGRKKRGADGEETPPWAHAPHYPGERRPCYSMLVGDHKLNRIFIPPFRFTDVGYSSVRTIRHQIQAPPAPGLYTFQAYIKSDCYLGTDLQISMSLKVEPPKEGQEADGEDEISDPEEDTIAGQMAAMRGQPTKRRKDDDDDDDDSSATDSSDDSSSSSSDSDSDSD